MILLIKPKYNNVVIDFIENYNICYTDKIRYKINKWQSKIYMHDSDYFKKLPENIKNMVVVVL